MSAASSVPQRLRRVLFLLVIPAIALCALALAGNARADGPTSPPDPSAAAPSGAEQGSSSATTDQGAIAGANATQQQPSNVVNSARVDSPGDDGAITQANTAQGQAAAANGSATTQAGGSPSSPGGGGRPGVPARRRDATGRGSNRVRDPAGRAEHRHPDPHQQPGRQRPHQSVEHRECGRWRRQRVADVTGQRRRRGCADGRGRIDAGHRLAERSVRRCAPSRSRRASRFHAARGAATGLCDHGARPAARRRSGHGPQAGLRDEDARPAARRVATGEARACGRGRFHSPAGSWRPQGASAGCACAGGADPGRGRSCLDDRPVPRFAGRRAHAARRGGRRERGRGRRGAGLQPHRGPGSGGGRELGSGLERRRPHSRSADRRSVVLRRIHLCAARVARLRSVATAAALSRGSSNRLDDPQAGRSRRLRWGRGIAVTVCVCAALAAPGRVHAAAPSLGGLNAQVQSALAQVNEVAPAAVAAVQPAVDQALAASSVAAPATPPAAATPPATTAPESTPRAPESVPSTPADVIEPVVNSISAATNAVLATVPVPELAQVAPQATPAAHADHAQRPLRARDSPGVTAAAARPATIPQSLSPTSSAAPASPQVEPVGGRVERSRTPDKPAAGGGSLPQRLPPQSPVPQPDAGAPGTGAGSGSSPLLLLIGALAAGFALFSFPVHHRRLPRTAFLKPRRVVLAVWHPG